MGSSSANQTNSSRSSPILRQKQIRRDTAPRSTSQLVALDLVKPEKAEGDSLMGPDRQPLNGLPKPDIFELQASGPLTPSSAPNLTARSRLAPILVEAWVALVP